MQTTKQQKRQSQARDGVEFEPVAPRTDVQLTKPFPTGDGEEMLRALITTRGAVVLTPVGPDTLVDSVVVTSTDDVLELSWGGGLWKPIKKAIEVVSDLVLGDGAAAPAGGGDCKPTANVNVNVSGGSISGLSVTVNNNCKQ